MLFSVIGCCEPPPPERDKFDFDHYFDQIPKKIELFIWWHLFRLVERIIFKKNTKAHSEFIAKNRVLGKYGEIQSNTVKHKNGKTEKQRKPEWVC